MRAYIDTKPGVDPKTGGYRMKTITCVWANDMTAAQTEELRFQVNRALKDPHYVIVTNFPVEGMQLDIPEEGDAQGVPHQCCGAKGHSLAATKKVVAIVAPNTKSEDILALQKQIEEALAGPKHYFVTNQPIEVWEFDAPVSEARPE